MSIEPSSTSSNKKKKSWNEKKRQVNFYDEKLSLDSFIKAIDSNDVAMVEAYLKHGQDPNEHTGNYITPLHIACMHGFERLVEIFLQHPKIQVNPVDHLGRTPLSRACRYHFMHIVLLLLEHNADCNIADRTGYTPLHHTALWGWVDIMEVLLQYDANPNMSNAFGKTPLHLACVDNANMKMVQMLCNHGADIDMECPLVMPVLLVCCMNCFDYDNLNMIDLLIYNDADVNVVYNLTGQTAMHIAAINGFVPLAEILCTAGANPNVLDKQFRTPFDLALQMENEEMVNFLRIFFVENVVPVQGNAYDRRRATLLQINRKNERKRHYENI